MYVSWDISLTSLPGGIYFQPDYNIYMSNPYSCLQVPVNAHIFINLSVLSCLGSKSQKHVLRPESLEGTDEEDPVSALEWDLLSTDYLLGWTKN